MHIIGFGDKYGSGVMYSAAISSDAKVFCTSNSNMFLIYGYNTRRHSRVAPRFIARGLSLFYQNVDGVKFTIYSDEPIRKARTIGKEYLPWTPSNLAIWPNYGYAPVYITRWPALENMPYPYFVICSVFTKTPELWMIEEIYQILNEARYNLSKYYFKIDEGNTYNMFFSSPQLFISNTIAGGTNKIIYLEEDIIFYVNPNKDEISDLDLLKEFYKHIETNLEEYYSASYNSYITTKCSGKISETRGKADDSDVPSLTLSLEVVATLISCFSKNNLNNHLFPLYIFNMIITANIIFNYLLTDKPKRIDIISKIDKRETLSIAATHFYNSTVKHISSIFYFTESVGEKLSKGFWIEMQFNVQAPATIVISQAGIVIYFIGEIDTLYDNLKKASENMLKYVVFKTILKNKVIKFYRSNANSVELLCAIFKIEGNNAISFL